MSPDDTNSSVPREAGYILIPLGLLLVGAVELINITLLLRGFGLFLVGAGVGIVLVKL
jgi:hypothetical protein